MRWEGITKKSVLQLPMNTPAVYFFQSSKGEILYVGKSKDIRRRMYDYITRAKRVDEERIRNMKSWCFEHETRLHVDVQTIALLEAKYIWNKKPLFNKNRAIPGELFADTIGLSDDELDFQIEHLWD